MKIVGNTILVAALLACASCATVWQTQHEREIENQLASVVVPECCFRSADIHCVVAFLNGSMADAKTQPAPHIVLLLPHGKTVDLVDLDMKNASVLDIVRAVAKLTDSRFYIRVNHPYLEPRHPREEAGRDPFENDPFIEP